MLTVWIIDDDLGFVWLLGDIFAAAGCKALPALSCQEAITLTKQLGIEPDLVVINPDLEGVVEMLQERIGASPDLKVVTIGPRSEKLAGLFTGPVIERPSGREAVSRLLWLEKVQNLLRKIQSSDGGIKQKQR